MNVLDFRYERGYKTKCFLLFILSQFNFFLVVDNGIRVYLMKKI